MRSMVKVSYACVERGGRENGENLRAHSFSFKASVFVFDDSLSATSEAPYPYEQRWRTIRMVGTQIVMVVHNPCGRDEQVDSENMALSLANMAAGQRADARSLRTNGSPWR